MKKIAETFLGVLFMELIVVLFVVTILLPPRPTPCCLTGNFKELRLNLCHQPHKKRIFCPWRPLIQLSSILGHMRHAYIFFGWVFCSLANFFSWFSHNICGCGFLQSCLV
eukprot:Lithocolla_globosa_v1_NODE_3641_length_1618_cov_3.518874.p2 type:complete len:110 gc:universal NODE_3641_length_1618_cov_3.518874:450-779(+)